MLCPPSAVEHHGLDSLHVGPHHKSGEERRVHGPAAPSRPGGSHQAHQPHGRQQGPARSPAASVSNPSAECGGNQHDRSNTTSGKPY